MKNPLHVKFYFSSEVLEKEIAKTTDPVRSLALESKLEGLQNLVRGGELSLDEYIIIVNKFLTEDREVYKYLVTSKRKEAADVAARIETMEIELRALKEAAEADFWV